MAIDKHPWGSKERKDTHALRGQVDRAVIHEQVDGEKGIGSAKRRKKDRPFTVECNWNGFGLGTEDRWVVWGRYETPARRDQALAQLQKNRHGRMKYRAGTP